MSYKPGFCSDCGEQIWITDYFGRPVTPMANLREGYLKFGSQFLKIPICNDCENNVSAETMASILAGLNEMGEAMEFQGKMPDGYEKFEPHWAARGKEVKGPWRIYDNLSVANEMTVKEG